MATDLEEIPSTPVVSLATEILSLSLREREKFSVADG
jgi:hypothetical protein